jgi:hypothetical protein
VLILRWVTVVWPGLPLLWLRGEWSGLMLAGGFSALVNLAIVATWGWTELLSPPLLGLAWGGVILFWTVSIVTAIVQMPGLLRVPSIEVSQDLFRTAQGEYLKGNWFEAELALNRLLEHDPTDIEAHLMLSTLLRRIGQAHEACQRLDQLVTLEGSARWQLEISRERQLLQPSVSVPAQNVQVQRQAAEGLPNAA